MESRNSEPVKMDTIAGKTPKTPPGVTTPAKLPPDQDPWVNQAIEVIKSGKARKLAKKAVKS